MAKVKEKTFRDQFLEVFHKLSYCRSSWDVWNDFLSVSAIAIANCVPGWSLDRDTAMRYYNGRLFRAIVNKQDIFAYFSLNSDEEEIVAYVTEGYEIIG